MDAGTHRITRVATMLVGLLIAVAAIAPAAHADAYDPADWSPSIWSDQADYAPGADALDVGNGATNDCGTTTNPMPASWLSITSPTLPKTITGPTTFALR